MSLLIATMSITPSAESKVIEEAFAGWTTNMNCVKIIANINNAVIARRLITATNTISITAQYNM